MELKEQLVVEEEDGDRQEEKIKRRKGETGHREASMNI